jgi:hypothetical protein
MKKVAYALSAALCLLAVRAEANASIYHGFPHLHLTMAAVDAGGGARSFNSRRLMDRLAGPRAATENAKLVRQYGPARVDAYYAVYTYAMTDAIKKAHNMLIPLPGSAHPTPNDAPALAIALYNAGIAGRPLGCGLYARGLDVTPDSPQYHGRHGQAVHGTSER